MSHLKMISFDLDGTLVDHSFSNAIWHHVVPELVAQKTGMTREEAKSWVFSQYQEVGEASLEWYDLEYWFKRFGLREDWREVLARHRDLIRPFPEVRGVLESLAQRYPLMIVSNASRAFIEEELSHKDFQGLQFFRIVSATSDWGQVKKTGGFYRRLCEALGIDPTRVVHVGDHEEFDFLAPKEAGMEAYFLDRSGVARGDHVVRDLEEFSLKVTDGHWSPGGGR
jgi:putative hydrolase of the HAD superfamily